MRKLLILASAMIFFDVAFFAAIAPLLPDYVEDLGLSKAQAGVLSAAYAAGTLLASLPAGFVASRVGPRRTVVVGLLLLGVASLAFGLVDQILLLDVTRFIQGIAGALIWSGALTWLITMAPDENRGSVIGTALGTAVAGALLGPVLGAVAASVGTELVFGAVLVVAVLLAVAALRMPEGGEPERQDLHEVVGGMTSRPVIEAVTFVTVPSVMFGAVEVLVPLRIDALGGGHAVIAAGFIVGAGIEAVLAPLSGRFSDRIGRRFPYMLGLSICSLAMVGFAVAMALGPVLAALILTSLGAGLCFTPAMTILSEAADTTALHQGFAAGLSNMAWALGQVLGGVGGGGLASVGGNALPSLVVAALLAVTVVYAFRFLASGPVSPAEARLGEG
jgi:MFS family permease